MTMPRAFIPPSPPLAKGGAVVPSSPLHPPFIPPSQSHPHTPWRCDAPVGRAHAYASHKGRVPSVAGGDAGAVPMPPLANGLGVAGVGYLFALRRGRGVPA